MTTHARMEPLGDWADDAACQGETDKMFGPDYEGKLARLAREKKAVRVCADCPVVAECLDYAVRTNLPHGVWGGMGEDERARYRRRARRNELNAAKAAMKGVA